MDQSGLEETYLTVAEVAELLKLNQQTVRNWIDQGSLPALRVGRRVRIKRSDFERVIAEGYRPRGAAPRAPAPRRDGTPSAVDFWGGEPVGLPEPAASVSEPAALVDGVRSTEGRTDGSVGRMTRSDDLEDDAPMRGR